MTHRKGAVRIADIPPEILESLNRGEIETANLPEWLAVDQLKVAENVLPSLGMEAALPKLKEVVAELAKKTQPKVLDAIGTALAQRVSYSSGKRSLYQKIATHQADSVRSWAAYLLRDDEALTFFELLEAVKPLAADSHFGVREVAWMALRGHIATHLSEAITILTGWANDTEANVRRFASEATRPCGVWTPHIPSLKQNPGQAASVLEPLRSDVSKYVRDSVGNWLNDASKTTPEWVKAVCTRWETESKTAETVYIIKKAMRTIRKTDGGK
ncbi:MAG: DNA alkylation repair protein [Gemmataceae bacterium]